MNLGNIDEIAAMILFGIGFTTLLLDRNLIKKIIGFSMMDSAMYLFLAAKGYIEGRKAPIVVDGVTSMEAYVNPIPAGLVLTGIVVSVSVSAVMLSLTVRLYRRYHTLDIDQITMMARHEQPDKILATAVERVEDAQALDTEKESGEASMAQESEPSHDAKDALDKEGEEQ